MGTYLDGVVLAGRVYFETGRPDMPPPPILVQGL